MAAVAVVVEAAVAVVVGCRMGVVVAVGGPVGGIDCGGGGGSGGGGGGGALRCFPAIPASRL